MGWRENWRTQPMVFDDDEYGELRSGLVKTS